MIEPESKDCPCCGGELHVIGEDTSKRLDKTLRVVSPSTVSEGTVLAF